MDSSLEANFTDLLDNVTQSLNESFSLGNTTLATKHIERTKTWFDHYKFTVGFISLGFTCIVGIIFNLMSMYGLSKGAYLAKRQHSGCNG